MAFLGLKRPGKSDGEFAEEARCGLAFARRFGPIVRAFLTILAMGAQAPSASAQTAAVEYAVKANYLYKFGPSVEWPPRTFPTPTSPFNVCVSGEDPFGTALEDAVKGQTVDGHPVEVRRLREVSSNTDCRVLYIGRSRTQSPAEALKAMQGAPVLTVTDDSQGVSGGIVHFLLKGGRVRFALNVHDAQESGLTISSKLQGLAVSVERAGG